MAKDKEITNNELLEFIKSGFSSFDSKFNGLESRFDNLETRFDKLTTEVINIKEELKGKADRKELVQFKDEILTAIDTLSKKYENHEAEHIANLGAHQRMQSEINETRQKLGLKTSPIAA
jgi:predicted  nucleic acid-binding Zn-ribbon protein